MIDQTNGNMALASAFVEELARCGVRRAVVSPGSRSTPLAIALYRRPEIDVSVVIDERSAGFLALGAAQASGRPVALLCTSGTAAANYLPAIVEADLSAVPLIALTADRPPELRDVGAGQTIDQIKLYGNAVRWFCEVGTHVADDAGLLHLRATACRAFTVAKGDPQPGPVQLNFAWREPLAPIDIPDQVTARQPLAIEGRGDRPLTTVMPVPDQPEPAAVATVAESIADIPRGLILAGRQTDPSLREGLSELAARTGYPILAEPTSQLRLGPHDLGNVIWAYDEILGRPDPGLMPDLILRFGEIPTSKRLRLSLLQRDQTEQVVVPGPYLWNEPSRIADTILRGGPGSVARALCAALDGEADVGHSRPGYLPERAAFREAWRLAQRESAGALLRRLEAAGDDTTGLSGAALHHALAASYRDGDVVYTNSSMAIREQEAYLTPASADVLFLANRGANGIDGLISSGIGAAIATGRPTTIISGDVGLLHDIGALANWKLSTAPIRLIVVNDGGGTIFSRLPQHEVMPALEFETLMTTPPGIEPAAVANLFDLPYRRLADLTELPEILSGGSVMLEVPTAG